MAESLDMNNPFYYAQNIFDSDVEEVRPPSPPTPHPIHQTRITTNTQHKKRKSWEEKNFSFVKKRVIRKGIQLIKIEVIDLEQQQRGDILPSPTLSASHVVVDPGDDILNSVENIISKISKRISDSY